MNKEFIPYEQALEIKELGFNELCLAFYNGKNFLDSTQYDFDLCESTRDIGQCINAPLYQQAFRWFRDKKLSDSCICRYQSRDDGGVYYYFVINHDFGIEETKHYKEGFYTYEEAELACLKKLIEIEIVKNK